MGFIINPYQVQPSGPSYGTLTTAWITATGETDTTILGALNTLESDLTTYGLTSKLTALYPFVGGTATKHKYNFMDARDLDAAYRLVFNGGWTHGSNGATPNGTNGYADTYYIPSNNLSDINSNHISIYSRTNNQGGIDMGCGSGSSYWDLELYYSGTSYNWNMASYFTHTNTNSTGLFINTRTANNSYKLIKNGSTILNSSTGSAGSTKPNNSVNIGRRNPDALYTAREYAFASIGDGLNDTEASNFYTAVQAFQTALSRNV